MKYKTTIELICEATNKEEATNIAGEYLNGDIDFGVSMNARTDSVVASKVKRYAAVGIFSFIIISSVFLNMYSVSVDAASGKAQVGFKNTYTMMPLIKTKHRAGFKNKWEEKKNEVVLQYLKD